MSTVVKSKLVQIYSFLSVEEFKVTLPCIHCLLWDYGMLLP